MRQIEGDTLMESLPMLIGCLAVFIVCMGLFIFATIAENSDDQNSKS